MKKGYAIVAMYVETLLFGVLISFSGIASANDNCMERDISDYQWKLRHRGGLPAQIEQEPGALLEQCIRLKGVGPHPLKLTSRDIEIAHNSDSFKAGGEFTIKEGDTLRLRVQAPVGNGVGKTYRLVFNETDPDRRRDVFRLRWPVQTRNDSRAPKTWHVGPSSPTYREVKDVLKLLSAGDTIILEPGATYQAFEAKEISGTRAQPITLKSNATDASKRAVIEGGTKRFNWTMGLTSSHNWVVENVILQGGGLCFRHASDNTTLRNVLIRHCKTGVLSTDFDSGDLTLDAVEIYDAGGKEKGRPWNHGIYVASDQHTFPGATFTLENSYLHDLRGNAVKSRFENSVIRHNWIENGAEKQSRYLVEVIGYDGQYDFDGQHHEVTDNMLVHRMPGLGSRAGGDGKSPSRGDAVFARNYFVIDGNYNRSMVRTFQGLNSLEVIDNRLVYLASPTKTTLVTDEVKDAGWEQGTPVITVSGNRVTSTTKLLERTAQGAVMSGKPQIAVKDNDTSGFGRLQRDTLDKMRPEQDGYIQLPDWPDL